MARQTSLMRVDDFFKRVAEEVRKDLEEERMRPISLVDASTEMAEFIVRQFRRRRK